MSAPADTGRAPGASGLWRRLTVQNWFHLFLVVKLTFIVVCAVVGTQLLISSSERTDTLTERIEPARVELYRLQTTLISQETGLRGFAIAREEQFLDPYTEGIREERESAERLYDLVGREEQLSADVAALTRAAATWRSSHAEPLIEKTRRGEFEVGASTELDESKHAFDELRTMFAVQNRHILELRETARAELDAERTKRDWLMASMLIAFTLSGIGLTVLQHRAVGRPLRSLLSSSQRVAKGDFTHRIDASGPADVRAVATAVEEMRERIVTELAESRSRAELLDQQAAGLDAQAAELRRSNAELEQFAYVASHDLQEPLRKVASFCQLLEKRYGRELDERAGQYIAFAVDGAKRMQTLINDLLTFSRVGRVNDDRRTVSLDDALDRALSNLSASIEESGALVERPEALPEVIGDVTTLTMLWQNLIGNAVKFRSPDRPARVTVTVEPESAGSGWRFCVADNGIGIPPEFREKVFVIFQRLHGRDAYAGTGIGLALCKKIVEHHGGQISLEPGDPEGTRVCFSLPDPSAFPTAPFAVPVPVPVTTATEEHHR
ncbi:MULTISPECIES: ATP-binding protein [Streptomyces]|uniref:sensor histidine kinase n=1 Tax=Streptomyces TaxID=1883 RepID=UPI001F1E5A65|nr:MULTISPECIES: sensor histidine kinase [Streptomyces]